MIGIFDMPDDKLVAALVQENCSEYVPLCQLKEMFKVKYGRDLKQSGLKKWVASLPNLCVNDDPVKDSVRISAKKKNAKYVVHNQVKKYRIPETSSSVSESSYRTALIGTLESYGGEIYISNLKDAYQKATSNNPPYPSNSIKRWIRSVEGVQIKEGWVQLVYVADKEVKAHERVSGTTNTRKGKKEKTAHSGTSPNKSGEGKKAKRFPALKKVSLPVSTATKTGTGKMKKAKKSKVDHSQQQIVQNVPQSGNNMFPKLKKSSPPGAGGVAQARKERQKSKQKKNRDGLLWLWREQTKSPAANGQNYYGAHSSSKPTGKCKKNLCIMHFGFSAQGKSTWSNRGKTKTKCKRRNAHKMPSRIPIEKGYLANKRKKAGGKKAGRKAHNLVRLKKIHNPPAVPSDHALQRYRERGASSTPIYKDIGKGRAKAIVVTYLFIHRTIFSETRHPNPKQLKIVSETKHSERVILSEVERMTCSAKRSGLERSKLSSRDEYLLKLSSEATKKQECKRRRVQRAKAYNKGDLGYQQQVQVRPGKSKVTSRQQFGTRRCPWSWAPQSTTNVMKEKLQKKDRTKQKKKTKKMKTKQFSKQDKKSVKGETEIGLGLFGLKKTMAKSKKVKKSNQKFSVFLSPL